ncbi:hypothetical protein ACFPK9_07010 [Rubritalea spongiae]|uniref:Uncharacterized protein n=1 Tax=Rubritalea spongiae TaxID=430797 RepID=A0ABW5E1F0_9BACT
MKIPSSFKSTIKCATVTAGAILTTSLTNCGGGDGDSDRTIRPKSLEEVVLTLGGQVSFEFIRSSNSTNAENNGDTETGTFIYTVNASSSPTIQQNSINDFPITIGWPVSIGSASYQYTPINDSSGELLLTTNDSTFSNFSLAKVETDNNGNERVVNPGNHSYWSGTVKLIVSWQDNGNASSADVRMEDDSSTDVYVNSIGGTPVTVSSTSLTTAQFTLATGGALPLNYDPPFDADKRDSKISPTSVGGNSIFFNDLSNSNKDFTLQLTSKGSVIGAQVDDSGSTVYIDHLGDTIINAADYTYDRVTGSDGAILELSGGSPQDGSITLEFTSADTDTQNAGGTYTTSNGDSGSFVMFNEDSIFF